MKFKLKDNFDENHPSHCQLSHHPYTDATASETEFKWTESFQRNSTNTTDLIEKLLARGETTFQVVDRRLLLASTEWAI